MSILHQKRWNCLSYNQRWWCSVSLCRQSTLVLEWKIPPKDWTKCVCLSIVGIFINDTYLFYKKWTQIGECQKDFYELLSEELSDNTHGANVDGTNKKEQVDQK